MSPARDVRQADAGAPPDENADASPTDSRVRSRAEPPRCVTLSERCDDVVTAWISASPAALTGNLARRMVRGDGDYTLLVELQGVEIWRGVWDDDASTFEWREQWSAAGRRHAAAIADADRRTASRPSTRRS